MNLILWTALLLEINPQISPCPLEQAIYELNPKTHSAQTMAYCTDKMKTCYIGMKPNGRSNQDMYWTCYDQPPLSPSYHPTGEVDPE